MATVPVRSQPLHNFSLPFLKWGKNQMNNQRCRKSSVDSSQEFPPLDHQRSSSSASETESDREIELEENRKNPIVSSSSSRSVVKHHHHRLPDILMVEKKNHPTMLESEGVEEGKSDFFLVSKDESPSVEKKKKKNKPSCVDVLDAGAAGGGEESATKPWNLRPRRVVFKAAPIEIEGSSREVQQEKPPPPPENLPKSLRLRGVSAEGGGQNVEKKKKEKQKFWISLSREEIEEDFFIMTGSKPSRRPKKRARNIQKQVDNVFPGLWLAGITADSYIVPDVPAKR